MCVRYKCDVMRVPVCECAAVCLRYMRSGMYANTKRNIQRHNMILCRSRYHLNTSCNHDYCRNPISISHTTLLLHSAFRDILKLAKSHCRCRYINLTVVYAEPLGFHIIFVLLSLALLVGSHLNAFPFIINTRIITYLTKHETKK